MNVTDKFDITDRLSISDRFKIPEEVLAKEIDTNERAVVNFIIFGGTSAFFIWSYILISILLIQDPTSYLT